MHAILLDRARAAGNLVAKFLDIPRTWRFAVGGFGCKVSIVDAGSDVGAQCVTLSGLAVANVPDGDLRSGSGTSELYVRLEMLDDDGRPTVPRRTVVRTPVLANAGTEASWEGQSFVLPLVSTGGAAKVHVSIWDEDYHKHNDPLGGAVLALTRETAQVDKAVLKGYPAHHNPHAPEGHVYGDAEISFAVAFSEPEQ